VGGSASANLLIRVKSSQNKKNRSVIMLQNDVILEEKSQLNIIQDQKIGRKVSLLYASKFHCLKNSSLNCFYLDQGSAVTDRYIDVEMKGMDSSAIITGLYSSTNGQNFYYDTQQNHCSIHANSDLLFKGVIGKKAYSSWKGNIFVSEDSLGTNGYQANRNLLVDPTARAESTPGLEILTDDVRCSHGVTMGNIDKNQMFYLQSRGIEKKEAERMIIEGYFRSTLQRIPDFQLRNYIQNSIEI
jgi:Fe-S cluster assembly protein SufD